jgi:sulfur relay (sulfurtransferase) DsrC/TusE family protein
MTTPSLPTDETAPDVAALRANPPTGEAQIDAARRLLRHFLDTRDAAAAKLAAEWMNAHPAIDADLWARLERILPMRPDAVYTFIRSTISLVHDDPAANPERAAVWRERMKVAALASLHVAITDGDSETVMNWLRLIAREPIAYGLNDVLHAGIAAAQERAATDSVLARGLVLLAARRTPVLLDGLLKDQNVRCLLPESLCVALHHGTGDADKLYDEFGAEVFLSVLYRATTLQQPLIFTPRVIERVWALTRSENGAAAIAEKLLKAWGAAESLAWLPADALAALLSLSLRDRREDLFYLLVSKSGDHPMLPYALFSALRASARSTSESLAIVAQIIANGHLTQQGAAEVYVGLLDSTEWDADRFDWAEQLARLMQQHQEVALTTDALWHMIAIASELKEDFTARAALRRLTGILEAEVEDEGEFAESIMRLSSLLHWAGSARAALLSWWREYTHDAQTAHLQRLERALPERSPEGRRADDLRAILGTTLAYRRMLGKRTLSQFADDVSTAFSVIQSLAEAFDTNSRRVLIFDPPTFRAEIEAHLDGIPVHERKILANHLKELAHLITLMVEQRSKATLVRRSEDIDRMLMTGDLDPHGAVDTIKWLSGLLSGAQQDDDDD